MSGGWVAVGAAAASAASSAASSMYSANKQAKAQRHVADQQAKAAAEAKKQQEMEFNKANQNEVDISGIMGQNQGGGSATMITGPGGVGKNDLLLGGGSSLLGG